VLRAGVVARTDEDFLGLDEDFLAFEERGAPDRFRRSGRRLARVLVRAADRDRWEGPPDDLRAGFL
jgi:hypothetical protein